MRKGNRKVCYVCFLLLVQFFALILYHDHVATSPDLLPVADRLGDRLLALTFTLPLWINMFLLLSRINDNHLKIEFQPRSEH